jgi:hypothetical protein
VNTPLHTCIGTLMYTILIGPQKVFKIEKKNKYYLWIYHNCSHKQMYQYTLNKMCTEEFTI